MAINLEIPRSYQYRPTTPPDLFEVLEDQYGLKKQGRTLDLGGSQNLNLKFTHNNQNFVARVYRPWVSEARLRDLLSARSALLAARIPMPLLIKTTNGANYTTASGQFVEVEAFTEHDEIMNSWARIEMGIPWLGRVHTALKHVIPSPEGLKTAVSNSIEANEALETTTRAVKHVETRPNASPAELAVANQALTLANKLAEMEKDLSPQLPKQLVHGDFWDNNVFFENGRIKAVVDLDFMGLRPRIDDLALTLFYTNSTYRKQSQKSETRIRRLGQLVQSYEAGLEDNLSEAEKTALPLALARAVLAFVAMAPVIDDDQELRKHLLFRMPDIDWSLDIANNPHRWRKYLTS